MVKKSAGVFLLRMEKGELLFLLLMGKRSADLPKGGVEKTESSFQAAKRELKEETGIEDVVWLSAPPITIQYALGKHDKRCKFFLGVVGYEPKVVLSKEHTAYLWVPLRDAEKCLPERFAELAFWATSGVSGLASS